MSDIMQVLAGAESPSSFSDVLKPDVASMVRAPYESELAYFKSNPHVSGMAAEDNRVILNPYSNLSENQKRSVILNEAARIYMREHGGGRFAITDEQKERFRGYGSEQDVRDTIAARILSGDPSAGNATPEQIKYVSELRRRLNVKR